MNIRFHIRGLKEDDRLRGQLRSGLEELNNMISVTAAEIVLEHQPDITPSYQAVAVLMVRGPEIHAAARDHTWPAAWQKLVERLRDQIEERRQQQAVRHKKSSNTRSLGNRRPM